MKTNRFSLQKTLLTIITIFTMLFLIAPILVIIPLSFSSGELLVFPTPGYSLRWYVDFFTSSRWVEATKNSFIVATSTMVLATAIGTAGAFGIQIGRFPGKAFLLGVLSLPMITPIIVVALSMYFALSRVGLGSSLTGLVIAHTVLAVPYVIFTVLATLQTFDLNLLKAAASLGASPKTSFRRVVLPLIGPGVATGALFAFATSFDELVVALFIASPGEFTLPRQMYAGLREFLSPTIAAAAVLLVLLSVLLLLINEFIAARAKKQSAVSPNPEAH